MLEVADHPLIELLTFADLLKIEGHIGEFNVTIRKNPRLVSETKCTGCGACVDICPIYAPNEFDIGLGERKAIYRPFDQAVPNIFLIDEKRCIECRLCVKKCEPKAIELDQKPEIINLNVGTIIIASGFQTFNPIGAYGYGIYENVMTQIELERLLAPNGPTLGEVIRPSDGTVPKKVIMIQCVGSRNLDTHLHCSAGVCCMVAIKNANLLKHHINADIIITFMDIRAAGKGYEEYFLEARKSGIKFLRGNIASLKEDPVSKDLIIRVEDTLTQEILELQANLVVLSTAMEPSASTEELVKILRLEKSQEGFLKEYHPRLNPIDTKVPGIFLAGAVQGPKSIAEAVTAGKAAASSAAIPMIKKVHEIVKLEGIIDSNRCSGCGLCVNICPYQAITLVNNVAEIDKILCRGCGMCASICPSSAATLQAYRDDAFEKYLDALFSET